MGARVAVFGTGVMALGIARLCATRGRSTVVLSRSVDRAHGLARRVRDEFPDADVSTSPGDLVSCELGVEATVESLPEKRVALRELEERLPLESVVASTTSSLSITELGASLDRPERFLGIHFFNPVHRMPLVEIVAGLRTAEQALERGEALARDLGKRPLRVPDRAGFLINRLLIPYLNNAARLVEQGMATVADVDAAMTLGANHPMGPFALIDLIGADVCMAIGLSLAEEFHEGMDTPSPELRRRVALGLLGRKTGRGYYDYRSGRER